MNYVANRVGLASGLWLWVWLSTCASGAFIIEVRNLELTPGASGSLDVYIDSHSAANLLLFDYKFVIQSRPGSVGTLSFATVQADHETLADDYVFAGTSDGFTSQAQNSPFFDELVGGDFTDLIDGVLVTAPSLLVRLDVVHNIPSGSDENVFLNDMFFVSLVLDDSQFLDSGFELVDVSSTSIGEVRIVATPEPAVAVWGLALVLGGRLYQRRLRHRAKFNHETVSY